MSGWAASVFVVLFTLVWLGVFVVLSVIYLSGGRDSITATLSYCFVVGLDFWPMFSFFSIIF